MQRIILVLFFAVLAVSFAYAEEQGNQDKPKQDQSSAVQSTQAQSSEINAVVDAVDMKTKMVKFKADGSTRIQEADFTESTVFGNQNATLKAEDLKKGDRVVMEIDSTNVITRVELQPSNAQAEQAQQKQ